MERKLLTFLICATVAAGVMLSACQSLAPSGEQTENVVTSDNGAAVSESDTANAASSIDETAIVAADNAGQELPIEDTHSDDGRQVVGISMPSHLLERWNRDGKHLKRQFKKAGYEVDLAYADDLIDVQIHDIEAMIADGADLLIVSPIDASSLVHVLEQAQAVNIPVISYDRLIRKTDAVDYYISFDNYMVGALQGEYIEEALDLPHAKEGDYNIEFTSGDSADNNARYFYNGMFDLLEPYIESGILTVPSGQMSYFETAISSWSTDLAEERFSGLLNSYYAGKKKLDCAACANDSTALGVVRAITNDYHKKNTVVVTGQDADEPNLRNVVDGTQSMTVYKALSNEAVVALALGKAILEGQNPKEDLIVASDWDFDCVYDTESYDNGEGVVPSYLLTPVVITKDNLQEELIDTGYYVIGEDGYPVAASSR